MINIIIFYNDKLRYFIIIRTKIFIIVEGIYDNNKYL